MPKTADGPPHHNNNDDSCCPLTAEKHIAGRCKLAAEAGACDGKNSWFRLRCVVACATCRLCAAAHPLRDIYERLHAHRPACGHWGERHGSTRSGLYYLYSPNPRLVHTNADQPQLPLVLWLHGGTWMTEESLSRHDLLHSPFLQPEISPAFILRPLARKRHSWVSPLRPKSGSHALTRDPPPTLGRAISLLDHVLKQAGGRVSRLIVAGASMGGYATWQLVQRRPKLFEAAVPIAGGGDPSLAGRLRYTRLWIFHSADDPIVPVNASRDMWQALVAARGAQHVQLPYRLVGAGTQREAVEWRLPPSQEPSAEAVGASAGAWAEVRYTEYVGGGHDAWSRALSDIRLIRWVLRPSWEAHKLRTELQRGRPSAGLSTSATDSAGATESESATAFIHPQRPTPPRACALHHHPLVWTEPGLHPQVHNHSL